MDSPNTLQMQCTSKFNCTVYVVVYQDSQLRVDQACQAGQQFATLYYETMDKKRHVGRHSYFKSLLT